MLIACLNVYNEALDLARCLDSISGKVDRIVLVDGAYPDFPHVSPVSDDGTLEIAAAYGCEVITTADCDEVAKRNRYLVGDVGDMYIHLDGDEELIGNLPDLKEQDYSIELRRTDEVPPYPVYRMFAHRPGLHYRGTHHALWADGELLNKRDMPTLAGCHLRHHIGERTQQRVEARGTYYRKLYEEERAFRMVHGL